METNTYTRICLLLFVMSVSWMNSLSAQSRLATCGVPLTGSASGGQLILADALNRNASYVMVKTTPNEPASRVAQRLVDAINMTNPFGWHPHPGEIDIVNASDGYLKGLPGNWMRYMLAGTETGLGIPQSPRSLTVNFDEHNDRAVFRWRNAPGGYDRMVVNLKWENNVSQDTLEISGSAEEWTLDLNEQWWYAEDDIFSGLDVWIFGYMFGVPANEQGRPDVIPSNATALYMRHTIQEELYGIPFSGGTAPNWKAYTGDGFNNDYVSMGIREDLTASSSNPIYNPVTTRNSKPFYQIIHSAPSTVSGVMREFLGLTSGREYRLTIRLNTLDAHEKDGDWTFSFHATPTESDAALNHRQLAGLEPLPDGQVGPNAAQALKYTAEKTTKGSYEEFVTDITLPPGKDCITVWLRLEGGNDTIEVATDYISLEDRSAL